MCIRPAIIYMYTLLDRFLGMSRIPHLLDLVIIALLKDFNSSARRKLGQI